MGSGDRSLEGEAEAAFGKMRLMACGHPAPAGASTRATSVTRSRFGRRHAEAQGPCERPVGESMPPPGVEELMRFALKRLRTGIAADSERRPAQT
jgi:hypothetical protein